MHHNETVSRTLEPTRPCKRKRLAPADISSAEPLGSTGLPPDLEADAAHRLRVLALLYAFVFAVVGPLASVLSSAAEREAFLSSVARWAPALASIAMALLVAFATRCRRLSASTVLTMGLVFQVVGSYGIAAAQYLDINRYATNPPWAGLSWVAVWMLSFTTMVPSPPRRALGAAVASATAVPVVTGLARLLHGDRVAIAWPVFWLQVALPYVLVVVVAYVGARIVYGLGTQLTRARELGSYRLVELLGHGGMGEVWRAEHRLLARSAAIKLIRPGGAGGNGIQHAPELRARFEREAQVTSSLRSPHTIELYDFGIAEDGTFYYVMELLDGFDLQELVDRFGPLPPGRAVHLLTQVCHSLAEAHEHGLIHRDVKPANIYACRYGRNVDFVKVLDFGLVKPVEHEQGPTAIALTGTQAARGTPAFMSPEQAVGDRPVDHRTDIYALGCLAYWLVTGTHVFQGSTPIETIVRHVQAAPEPPSRRSPYWVPASFDDLVLACLAKDPEDRPATADIVAARLRATALEASWTLEQARQWWDAHHPGSGSTRQGAGRAAVAEREVLVKPA